MVGFAAAFAAIAVFMDGHTSTTCRCSLQVQQLASALQRLEAAGPHQAPRADGDAVAELERRLGDRQNRIEAALMQVGCLHVV